MNVIGYVESVVTITLDQDLEIGRWYGFSGKALMGDLHPCCTIQSNHIERKVLRCSTAGIRVNLMIDQFGDG